VTEMVMVEVEVAILMVEAMVGVDMEEASEVDMEGEEVMEIMAVATDRDMEVIMEVVP